MALATRCPHCQTTFRVAHDQLKLRAGLVRCGACKEIFNGVEHLLRPDEMEQVLAPSKPKSAPPAIVTPAAAPSPAPQSAFNDTLPATSRTDAHAQDAELPSSIEGAPAFADDTPFGSDATSESEVDSDADKRQAAHKVLAEDTNQDSSLDTSPADPLQRMTLLDITAYKDQDSGGPSTDTDANLSYADRTSDISAREEANPDGDELSQAIESLQNKPWRQTKLRKKGRSSREGVDKVGKAEPGFMANARRQKRYGKAWRVTMGAGSAILFVCLLLQGVYAFRHVIAARMPEYRPMLTDLCVQVGCQIDLPAQIDKVSIESSELQSLPSSPNEFTLVALLRNQATTAQAWPYLELTLNDMNEKPVARKVFQPRDYLPAAASANSGFPEQSEHQVRIAFEMVQLKAAGYRLYLFYP